MVTSFVAFVRASCMYFHLELSLQLQCCILRKFLSPSRLPNFAPWTLHYPSKVWVLLLEIIDLLCLRLTSFKSNVFSLLHWTSAFFNCELVSLCAAVCDVTCIVALHAGAINPAVIALSKFRCVEESFWLDLFFRFLANFDFICLLFLGAFFMQTTAPPSSPATDDVSPSLTAISLGGAASACNAKVWYYIWIQ